VNEADRMGDKLLERWSNPARRFHGIGHLITVLEKIDELSREASCPGLIRLAAFYHGAILSSGSGPLGNRVWSEDKALSADLARGQLAHLGLPAAKVARVHQLITALGNRPGSRLPGRQAAPSCRVSPGESFALTASTRVTGGVVQHPPNTVKDPDLAVLCDSERAILAADPRTYRAYSQALRAECGDEPVAAVLEARIAVLRGWLGKERLFLTASTTAWENAAHNNIEAELARSLTELDSLNAPARHPSAGLSSAVAAHGPLTGSFAAGGPGPLG
jgi:predicted metal-dependent HD superfamily phosphohydrolase